MLLERSLTLVEVEEQQTLVGLPEIGGAMMSDPARESFGESWACHPS